MAKGKGYEREIVNKLKEGFKIPFHRVPMSGGFQTIQNTTDSRFSGDVFTEDKEFNDKYDVVIECKKIGYVLDVESIALANQEKKNCTIYGWIKQCKRESNDKNFWLIFSWNRLKCDIIIRGLNLGGGDWHIFPPLTLKYFISKELEKDFGDRKSVFINKIDDVDDVNDEVRKNFEQKHGMSMKNYFKANKFIYRAKYSLLNEISNKRSEWIEENKKLIGLTEFVWFHIMSKEEREK